MHYLFFFFLLRLRKLMLAAAHRDISDCVSVFKLPVTRSVPIIINARCCNTWVTLKSCCHSTAAKATCGKAASFACVPAI